MFKSGCLLSLYAETPVHCGSGATFGAIDLPIQREKHTNLPVLPSSSIKGVLREIARHEKPGDTRIDEVFGPEKDGNSHAGAISPTDARLLLFPVRASKGIFAWVTCPFILRRLRRDLALATGLVLTLPDVEKLAVHSGVAAAAPPRTEGEQIVLEDDAFTLEARDEMIPLVEALGSLVPGAEYEFIRKRLDTHVLVIPDNDLIRLATSQTDVVTRNKLNDRKTTTGDGGNMWVQEYVPSDSLFYSMVLATASRKHEGLLKKDADVLGAAKALAGTVTHLQIGGDETVGKGWMRVNWIGV